MYELKTLLPEFEIKLPTCMYNLKPVSLSANASGVEKSSGAAAAASSANLIDNTKLKKTIVGAASQNEIAGGSTPQSESVLRKNRITTSTCALDLDVLGTKIQQMLKESVDADEVAARQAKLLKQLEELAAQMASIQKTLGLSEKNIQITTPQSGRNGGLREEPLHDVVINGHPNFIPYALLALKNAWSGLFTINVNTFTHSTLSDIGPAAREFEENLKSVSVDESKPKINITLIWKNCEHTEMISSPTMYVPIYGEVNIIRYLGRVGPVEYRYEESPYCNEIDAILDICYQLLRCTTPKSKAAIIRVLNTRLQKQKYFAGDQISIADIGVYSSLIRMPSITDKELTPALIEWRKRTKLVTKI